MAKRPNIAGMQVWQQLASATEGPQSYKEAKLIDLASIHPNPRQPRKTYNPETLQELAESIRDHGLLQPLIVRPEGDEFLIIAGHRRYEACKMLGLKQVVCIVREATELETMEQALIENLQREDINPVEEAQCYQLLRDEYSYSIRNLADKIKKSVGYIHSRLQLLEHADLAARVSRGEIGVFEARELAKIKDEGERQALAEQVASSQLDRERLKQEVKRRSEPAVGGPGLDRPPALDLNSLTRRWDRFRHDLEHDLRGVLAGEDKAQVRRLLQEIKQTIERMVAQIETD